MKCLLLFTRFIAVLLISNQALAQSKPHFNHQTVFVTDLTRASNFYMNVMLQDTIPEPFHDNHHTWFKIADHAELHVVSGAKEDVAHDINIHLAFTVSDLPAFMKHLDQMGVKYGNWAGEKKTQIRPDKIEQIYLQDPDGYWIEVNNDKF
jgi:lactoylglutathione lyase